MFIYYYVDVDLPLRTVADRVGAVSGLMSGFATDGLAACTATDDYVVRTNVPGFIKIDCRRPAAGIEGITYPLRWDTYGSLAVPSEMTADLSLVALGPKHTKITFRGTYRPSVLIPQSLDATLLHNSAELVVKAFVDRFAKALVDATAVMLVGVS